MDEKRLTKIATKVVDKRWWILFMRKFWIDVFEGATEEDVCPLLEGTGDFNWAFDPPSSFDYDYGSEHGTHTDPGVFYANDIPDFKIVYQSTVLDLKSILKNIEKNTLAKLIPKIGVDDFLDDPKLMEEFKTQLAIPVEFGLLVQVLDNEWYNYLEFWPEDGTIPAIVSGKIVGNDRIRTKVKFVNESRVLSQIEEKITEGYEQYVNKHPPVDE